MKLERISANKIKYSITFEELTNKGFLQDEILKESFLWDVLFDEMLDEAGRIFELNHFGAVSVEIFSLTSKELVLILTIEEDDESVMLEIDSKMTYSNINGIDKIEVPQDVIDNAVNLEL